MREKPLEIFCGTGGVGKTTLAVSRALSLARHKRILVVTIDPAKRLKQVLNLEESAVGNICRVSSKNFYGENTKEFFLDALVLDPATTLRKICPVPEVFQDFNNKIVKTLTRPYGGMNEMMAAMEIGYQLKRKEYDSIVLDTPPGSHVVDFLQASEKIGRFLDLRLIRTFASLQEKAPGLGMVKSLFLGGARKPLDYLGKVTGPRFVEALTSAIGGIYKNRDIFMDVLNLEKNFKEKAWSNWFLVVSAEQGKIRENRQLLKNMAPVLHEDSYLVVNKSLAPSLEKWHPTTDPLLLVKSSLLQEEKTVQKAFPGHFKGRIPFPDILESSPRKQVASLGELWYDASGSEGG